MRTYSAAHFFGNEALGKAACFLIDEETNEVWASYIKNARWIHKFRQFDELGLCYSFMQLTLKCFVKKAHDSDDVLIEVV